MESLGYLLLLKEENELKNEKEEADKWINFMSMHYAHPETGKEGRNNFIKLIEPKQKYDPIKNPIPEHDWDLNMLTRMKEQQERG